MCDAEVRRRASPRAGRTSPTNDSVTARHANFCNSMSESGNDDEDGNVRVSQDGIDESDLLLRTRGAGEKRCKRHERCTVTAVALVLAK